MPFGRLEILKKDTLRDQISIFCDLKHEELHFWTNDFHNVEQRYSDIKFANSM